MVVVVMNIKLITVESVIGLKFSPFLVYFIGPFIEEHKKCNYKVL